MTAPKQEPGIQWSGMKADSPEDYEPENGVDEPSGEFYCVFCAERCEEPPPGEPPVCEDEECRREWRRQAHPEDFVRQEVDDE